MSNQDRSGSSDPTGRSGIRRPTEMSAQAQACEHKAAECGRRALMASDPELRDTYWELAEQWRDMARQQAELLERHQVQAKIPAAQGCAASHRRYR
jgi:hypothetical protein